MPLISMPGCRALSSFRLDKLAETVSDVCAVDPGLSANYVHFIHCNRELTDAETELCQRLLDYGELPSSPALPLLTVVPRLGTISPWSSKATDIFHVCGLQAVNRVERGVDWYVQDRRCAEDSTLRNSIANCLFDPMTESVLRESQRPEVLFAEQEPVPFDRIELGQQPVAALNAANSDLGLALSDDEIEYLIEQYRRIGRDPTDVELMMFAQANSEHCRHKIFNASWRVDGDSRDASLFSMVRETHAASPTGTLVAYNDNAAVLSGHEAQYFSVSANSEARSYQFQKEPVHFVAKVETHNHPTAISPFAGAATGSGGEIRDEGATGRGAKPKAGLTGFSVSNLHLPQQRTPWELEFDPARPRRIASALEIMLDGPIGAASFNNEFGRPGIAGYFRTLELPRGEAGEGHRWGYHKPIMLAGGVGNIRTDNIYKNKFAAGCHIVVLGGPAMLIGMGGGAASSMVSGESSEHLDFASVQRSNPEMQRRCQQVVDACVSMGDDNPILAIHDVGAGGLSNAVPELIHEAGRGGQFELRNILIDESGMTPMQVWCNESQERYVVAVADSRLKELEEICSRERCLYCVLGKATENKQLVLTDRHFANDPTAARPIDIDLDVILGKAPRLSRDATRVDPPAESLDRSNWSVEQSLDRVLHLPGVADKSFLITIGDRTITGLVARDSMVGPWQIPVADVAVTASSFRSVHGEAMAIGERAPIALVDAAASARMALAEAVTNIAAADIDAIDHIRLSANWMAAAGDSGQDAALFDAVETLTRDVCVPLGIAIPVGKDSLSMRTVWQQDDSQYSVTSPLSLVITAFAPVSDIALTMTPVLNSQVGDSRLLLIDLAAGRQRLAGSALAQVYNQIGQHCPDLQSPDWLRAFFIALRNARREELILAYHDRSDGGLIVSALEMAFASRMGLELDIGSLGNDHHAVLFNEECGAVIQVRNSDVDAVRDIFDAAGIAQLLYDIGQPVDDDAIRVSHQHKAIIDTSRAELQRAWSQTSWQMQRLRDNPDCADQEYHRIADAEDIGLAGVRINFDPNEDITAHLTPAAVATTRPMVAVLREQGVNGQVEMAAAFVESGFDAIDVTMTDIISGDDDLSRYRGVVACGGFSFGDVLGAGQGWAKAILYNQRARDVFSGYFQRADTFTLGVCNGCQMLAAIAQIIPGASNWPQFVRNSSEQFEGRLTLVNVADSASILTPAMSGSTLPIAIAHGEGRARFKDDHSAAAFDRSGQVVLRYVDYAANPTQRYPFNPNGSPFGIAGITSEDGRVTALMPHPERVFRVAQHSWAPADWYGDGPWLRLFRNARLFVAK